MTAPFAQTLTSVDQLAELYQAPYKTVANKAIDHLDDGCRRFIAVSSFVVLGTGGADGRLDASPRGGPAGFIKVLDEHRLAIPDLNGNNRLDSLRNIIERPAVGLLFVIPGRGDTLRVNGRAFVTTDPDVLDRFVDDIRRPVSAIGVEVQEAYLHCAKAFRRGGLWDPARWPAADAAPTAGEIFRAHLELDEVSPEAIDADLEKGYELGLAHDRPVTTTA